MLLFRASRMLGFLPSLMEQTETMRASPSRSSKKAKPPRSSCTSCNSKEIRLVFKGHHFDDRKQKYDLVECVGCGLVRTDPFPAPEQLTAEYDEEYYGSQEKKFAAPLEAMVEPLARKPERRRRAAIRWIGWPQPQPRPRPRAASAVQSSP